MVYISKKVAAYGQFVLVPLGSGFIYFTIRVGTFFIVQFIFLVYFTANYVYSLK